MGFSPTFRDQVLNGVVPASVFLSLHSADPGTTGASEISGTTRQVVGLNTSTANAGRVTSQAIMSPLTGTATFYGVWDAASGGNFLWSGTLGASQTATFLLSVTLTD